jgi:hypothetical protein
MKAVVLKPGRDKALRHRHHWIFSGAIRDLPDFEDGDILPVHDAGGGIVGHAYFNRRSSITGRMVSFGEERPEAAIRRSLDRALALRAGLFDPSVTNARRLVNAEGDGLPGLVADLYDDVLVIQIATLGMDRLKPLVVEALAAALRPRTILERSDLPARREEGLDEAEGVLSGEPVDRVRILEDGVPYWVALSGGQKTGFYLDQRESRRLVRVRAAGRRVLNTFAYTGSFSVCALLGRQFGRRSGFGPGEFRAQRTAGRLGALFHGRRFRFPSRAGPRPRFHHPRSPGFRQEKDRRRSGLPRLQRYQPAGPPEGPGAGPGPDLLLLPFRGRGPLPAGHFPGRP